MKTHNQKNDHNVNPHAIRPMIYIIAKQWWEHNIWVQINMGVSKAIHACQWSNNHGIIIIIYKHQNML